MKLNFIIDEKYDKSYARDRDTLLYMDEQYESALHYLELSVILYQRSWDEISDDFSEYIKKVTDYDWFYDIYECVVSVVHTGISNWGEEPKIIRTWRENPYFMRRITAHELILSHYFEIIKRHYASEKLTDNQIWALAEISAFALTSLDPTVKKFWPWATEYYTNHNYPQIVEVQNELKDVFLKRKSFDEYIIKGIALIKKYPNMNPQGK